MGGTGAGIDVAEERNERITDGSANREIRRSRGAHVRPLAGRSGVGSHGLCSRSGAPASRRVSGEQQRRAVVQPNSHRCPRWLFTIDFRVAMEFAGKTPPG